MSEVPTSQQVQSGERASRGIPAWRGYLRGVGALVWKDLVAELRSRELLGSMLVFSALVILVFNFALELQIQLRASLSSGVLWVTLAFAGTLGLNRSMALEREGGCLDGLLLTPVDRSALYFGKSIANLLFILIVALVTLPFFGALYNVSLLHPGMLLVIVLGAVGYASVGTLLSTMAVQTRTRDVLLPILLFPVVLPVLIAAVKASTGYLQGLEPGLIAPWLNLLIVYDVIFVAVAMMVFEFVVQE
ncbi:MAG: heme exporter protein CcmB [Anaerolineales bacterium]|nr:heme exporter protein CcmB [Anaerolineales bacterium]